MDRLYHQPAHAILLCQRVTHTGGTGISTSSPSPTTVVLGLGPDLPWADEPSPGNLGLSTCVFLARISLLIPAFSLLCRPAVLTICLQPAHYAPLPLVFMNTVIHVFSPLRTSGEFLFQPSSVGIRLSVTSSVLPRMKVFMNTSPKLRWCVLAPLHLRRTITRPVSYYALFECVAASKPTSWLSMQLHILSHLTHTLGP